MVWLMIHKKKFRLFYDFLEVVNVCVELWITSMLSDDHLCERWASICVKVNSQFCVVPSGRDVHFA